MTDNWDEAGDTRRSAANVASHVKRAKAALNLTAKLRQEIADAIDSVPSNITSIEDQRRDEADAAARAIGIPIETMATIKAGTAVVVPKDVYALLVAYWRGEMETKDDSYKISSFLTAAAAKPEG